MHARNIGSFDGEEILDLGARTDGQMDYQGHAPAGSKTSDNAWVIYKFTYTTVGSMDVMIRRQVILKGVWDDRSSYF